MCQSFIHFRNSFPSFLLTLAWGVLLTLTQTACMADHRLGAEGDETTILTKKRKSRGEDNDDRSTTSESDNLCNTLKAGNWTAVQYLLGIAPKDQLNASLVKAILESELQANEKVIAIEMVMGTVAKNLAKQKTADWEEVLEALPESGLNEAQSRYVLQPLLAQYSYKKLLKRVIRSGKWNSEEKVRIGNCILTAHHGSYRLTEYEQILVRFILDHELLEGSVKRIKKLLKSLNLSEKELVVEAIRNSTINNIAIAVVIEQRTTGAILEITETDIAREQILVKFILGQRLFEKSVSKVKKLLNRLKLSEKRLVVEAIKNPKIDDENIIEAIRDRNENIISEITKVDIPEKEEQPVIELDFDMSGEVESGSESDASDKVVEYLDFDTSDKVESDLDAMRIGENGVELEHDEPWYF